MTIEQQIVELTSDTAALLEAVSISRRALETAVETCQTAETQVRADMAVVGDAASVVASKNAASASANNAASSALAASTSATSAEAWAQDAKATATGRLIHRGNWSAASGYYPTSPLLGYLYKITVAGTISGTSYIVGDFIVYNGSTWDKFVSISKSDLGLGNVSNTSDANKPISTATQAALNGKSDISHLHTKGEIGLGSVDNTADIDKPVSTPVQNALNAKASTAFVLSEIATAIANLVATAPGTLDTLKELATALGNDPNFATTIATALAGKFAKAGDTMAGTVAMANNALTGIKTATFNGQGSIATTTGAATIDWSAAQNYVQTEPTGVITYTFTAPPGPCHLQLLVQSDGTSSAFTHGFPTNVKWLGLTWAAVANKAAIINFWYDGTTYWAAGMNQV